MHNEKKESECRGQLASASGRGNIAAHSTYPIPSMPALITVVIQLKEVRIRSSAQNPLLQRLILDMATPICWPFQTSQTCSSCNFLLVSIHKRLCAAGLSLAVMQAEPAGGS